MRVLALGGYKAILGFEGDGKVATEQSEWNGIVVRPSEKAYEKTEEKEEEEEEEKEAEEEMEVSQEQQETATES